MKKKLLTQLGKVCLFTMLGVTVFMSDASAQKKKKKSSSENTPFHKGSKTVGFFLGTGVDYSYYGNGASMPIALGVTYDQGFFDNIGPGNIGIGGVLGYKSSKYDYYDYYEDYNFKNRYGSFIIGLRGTYHLTLLADKAPKFDPYAGITLGVSINTNKSNSADYYDTYYGYYNSPLNKVSTIAGAFVGAKYNFSKHVGVFAELGYDFTFARVGINANF